MPRRTRDKPPKVRRTWTRHPATRVQPDRRKYDRRRAGDTTAFDEAVLDLYEHRYARLDAPHGRVLGLDYGERRVGAAVSDPDGRIAHGLKTIETASRDETLDAVGRLAATYGARRIVVGLPVNMDGTEDDSARAARAFARAVEERTGVEVVLWDERLTSASAQRAMADMEQPLKGRKHTLDRISATLILQGYLDRARQRFTGDDTR